VLATRRGEAEITREDVVIAKKDTFAQHQGVMLKLSLTGWGPMLQLFTTNALRVPLKRFIVEKVIQTLQRPRKDRSQFSYVISHPPLALVNLML
jgi:hypothetical protein